MAITLHIYFLEVKISLPEPIRVSPLIRFSRWAALGLGILWGAWRLRVNSKWHADYRELRFEEVKFYRYECNGMVKTATHQV